GCNNRQAGKFYFIAHDFSGKPVSTFPDHALARLLPRRAGMARQVLFVQGGGAGTHDEWDNKLVDSLSRELGAGYDILYPRMPDEGDPNYARWTAALASEF